jgi:peptidoglycan hydrolase CwlO-like protein
MSKDLELLEDHLKAKKQEYVNLCAELGDASVRLEFLREKIKQLSKEQLELSDEIGEKIKLLKKIRNNL